ncbi:MAG: glycosyltransferase family 4 protein [Desulfuromonadales bacterium]
MKIAYIAPFGIRPKGTVIARMVPLAAELVKQGHVVKIVAPPYTNPEDSGKVETVQGVTIQNVTLWPGHKAIAALPIAMQLFKSIQQFQPDIIHLFKPKGYGGLAAMMHLLLQRAGFKRPPLIVDSDDWEGNGGMNDLRSYSGAEKKFYRFQGHWLLSNAAGITVASRELKNLIATSGTDRRRVMYLPNGVTDAPQAEAANVRKRLGIADSEHVVVLYTRYFEFSQKRLHAVFCDIYHQIPDVRFLIIGAGRENEEEQLKEAATIGGFLPALVFAGWVDPLQLPSYLAVGDIALYPLDNTLVNRCKCPAKLTELLQAGVPVVADRVGQANEYIRHNETGFLCDPENRLEMVRQAVTLLRDREMRCRIGQAGRTYMLEHYHWSGLVNNLSHFYEESLHS